MVPALRALASLVGFLLLVLVALAGLAAAVFSLQGGEETLSLHGLSQSIGLDDLAGEFGAWLTDLEASGPVAVVAALAGLGAIVLGIALLVGALVPSRERLVIVRRDERGDVAARRRAVAQAATALAEQARDVISAKAKVRPRRSGSGGRLRVTADHARTAGNRDLGAAAREQIQPLAAPLSLSVSVRGRVPRRGGRVR
jgi:hypothetical protein